MKIGQWESFWMIETMTFIECSLFQTILHRVLHETNNCNWSQDFEGMIAMSQAFKEYRHLLGASTWARSTIVTVNPSCPPPQVSLAPLVRGLNDGFWSQDFKSMSVRVWAFINYRRFSSTPAFAFSTVITVNSSSSCLEVYLSRLFLQDKQGRLKSGFRASVRYVLNIHMKSSVSRSTKTGVIHALYSPFYTL